MHRPAPRPTAIDERALRRAFGRFATGVTLITAPGGPLVFFGGAFGSFAA